tara:strand:- start:438 stop:710 length:273 start_codon:yes stop_codon:yes gene_type:complete
MFNTRYTQLLQSRVPNLTAGSSSFASMGSGRTLQTAPPPPQTNLRRIGFGGHFKDAPPPFITEAKKDNKIERIKKVKKKKKDKPKIKSMK